MKNTPLDYIEIFVQQGAIATGDITGTLLFFDERGKKYDTVPIWETLPPVEEDEYEEKTYDVFDTFGRQIAQRGKLTYLTHVYAIGFILWGKQYASNRFSIIELAIQKHTQTDRVYNVEYAGADGIKSFHRLRKKTSTVAYLRAAALGFLLELNRLHQAQGKRETALAELDTQICNLNGCF